MILYSIHDLIENLCEKVIFKEAITSLKCNSKKCPQLVYSELLYNTDKTAWTTGILKGGGG